MLFAALLALTAASEAAPSATVATTTPSPIAPHTIDLGEPRHLLVSYY